MGGGISLEHSSSSVRFKRSDTSTLRSKREYLIRGNINEKRQSYAEYQAVYSQLLRSESCDERAHENYENLSALLISAIRKVTTGDNLVISELDIGLLTRVLRVEYFEAGDYIYREGEEIQKLFVVESGDIEATCSDLSARSISSGQLIGEFSLFMSLPSTESFQCISDCVLYGVERSTFVMIRKMTSIASLLQTSEWLQVCPALQSITPVQMPTLLSLMKPLKVRSGETLYVRDGAVEVIALVRSGEFLVEPPPSSSGRGQSREQSTWVDQLGIVSPSDDSMDVRDMSADMFLAKYIRSSRSTNPAVTRECPSNGQRYGSRSSLHTEDSGGVYLGPGSSFGWPVLRVRQEKTSDGPWQWVSGDSSVCTSAEPEAEGTGGPGVVLSPVTVRALKDSVCLVCNVDVMEKFLLDSVLHVAAIDKMTSTISEEDSTVTDNIPSLFTRMESLSPRAQHSSKRLQMPTTTLVGPATSTRLVNGADVATVRQFNGKHFEELGELGTGAFGKVVAARYEDDGKRYALKIINKANLLKGNPRLFEAERNMLCTFRCPFLLKLFGTFEDDEAIVLVTEMLDRGDLWSAIYDNPRYGEDGLPGDLVRFYMTCLVLAFDHIHLHHVTYRDLKPENVMIDSKGYLRLIDFGLAKKVPFEEEDAGGGKRVVYRAYSVCGTFGTYTPILYDRS